MSLTEKIRKERYATCLKLECDLYNYLQIDTKTEATENVTPIILT